MAPFFVGSKGGKCAAFSFPTPIPTFPEGEDLVASCRSSEGACGSGGILLFGRRWVLGHVLGALLRTAAGWRLAAGSVYGGLYLCGRNGSVLRYLVPLRRCVSDVDRSVVFVCWIVSPWPCRSGSDLRDLMPLRRLVIARG